MLSLLDNDIDPFRENIVQSRQISSKTFPGRTLPLQFLPFRIVIYGRLGKEKKTRSWKRNWIRTMIDERDEGANPPPPK